MITQAPIREPAADAWSPSWAAWFLQVFNALTGFKFTFNITAVIDFGSIAGHSQLSANVTVTNARPGDAVFVTPMTDTAGVIFTGAVTANNVVTVYAKNFTAGAIDPASMQYRIFVVQN